MKNEFKIEKLKEKKKTEKKIRERRGLPIGPP
jgi:hypothetical protein